MPEYSSLNPSEWRVDTGIFPTTRTERENTIMKYDPVQQLVKCGISWMDAIALRRIAMTLHSWHEKECGNDHGAIERDEVTGKVHWICAMTDKRYPARDMETPALKRLAVIMAKYPDHRPYIQGDPRGAALYILTPRNLEFYAEYPIDAIYNYGVAVHE